VLLSSNHLRSFENGDQLIVACRDIGAFRQPIVALDQGRAALEPAMLPAYCRRSSAVSLRTIIRRDYPLQTPSMRCSSCGSENREGRKFCAGCGATLSLACAACGAAISRVNDSAANAESR
jgi:hypothetical protein